MIGKVAKYSFIPNERIFSCSFFFFVTQNTINICKIMFLTKKKKKNQKKLKLITCPPLIYLFTSFNILPVSSQRI